jgi:hypothetical protein
MQGNRVKTMDGTRAILWSETMAISVLRKMGIGLFSDKTSYP